MKKCSCVRVLSLLVCLAPGCVPDSAGEELDSEGDAGSVSSEVIARNSMSPALLSSSILTPGMLGPGAAEAVLGAAVASNEARTLLRYAVRCALAPGQSFALSWTDEAGTAHAEEYEGELGLAPGWAEAPLSGETEQRLVSACLAALVNWYGAGVYVSMRAPGELDADSAELADYPVIEGSFWGNLFAPSPYLNACYQPGNRALARAALRDCAAGHIATDAKARSAQIVPCAMIALAGPCPSVCATFDGEGQLYTSCLEHPGVAGSSSTTAVITTALP